MKPRTGNDAQGYTREQSDEAMAQLAARKAGVSRDLRVVCGLGGCRKEWTGSPEWVFGARDAHRREKHAWWRPRKRDRPRIVPMPVGSNDNFDRARKRGTEATKNREAK